MKFKLTLATVMFSLSTLSFATEQQSTIKCPDISELKAARFAEANAVYDTNLWEVLQPSSQYGTENAWNFKVNIEAENKNGAMQQAVATLESMHLINGPEKVDDKWMCHYRSGQHDAVAIMNVPSSTVASTKSKKAVANNKKETITKNSEQLASK